MPEQPKKYCLYGPALNGCQYWFMSHSTDIRMPGMNGFEFCRRVKELRPEAPVILMSAFEINQSEFSKVMPHTTVDGFIQKPISVKKLKEFIDEVTSKAK